MTATDSLPLRDIHDFAANYTDRQGLRIIPMAVAVIIQAFPQVPSSFFGVNATFVVLGLGVLGYYLVGQYYKRRFGTVEEMPYQGVSITAQVVLVVIGFLISVPFDIIAHPPVFISGLLISGWLVITAWPSRRIRGEYLSMGLVLALFSFGQMVGIPQSDVARSYGFWFGAMLIVAGLRDHLAFVRFFPPPERQHE